MREALDVASVGPHNADIAKGWTRADLGETRMSATATSPLDIQEQVARIERSQEETRKFVAEQHKLIAEAAKLERDRRMAPIIVGATTFGALIAAAVTLLSKLIH